MTPPRVLIVGSTGVIGKAVAADLAQSFDLITASRHSNGGNHYVVDVAQPGQLHQLVRHIGPEFIVHLVGGQYPGVADVWRVNAFVTLELLEVVRHWPAKVVLFGSAAEYGCSASGLLREDAVLSPITEYGRAKVAQTMLAAGATERGVEVLILRPFNIVSPWQPPGSALGDLVAQIVDQRGPTRVVRCGRLDIERDYVPVGFVSSVIRAVLEKWPGSRVLNVCSGVGIRLEEVVAAVGNVMGIELAFVVDEGLARLAAADRVVGDPSALEKVTGLVCRPTARSLAETLVARMSV